MIRLSHRGVCVSDLARSEAFYKEGLGFADHQDHGIVQGPEMDKTMELASVKVHAKMLRHPDGPVIELLHFHQPQAFGPRVRRPMNQYGLTHLAFYVDDIEEAGERIVKAGGAVWPETRARFEAGRITMMICTDPDGVRIELMQADGVPARFSHSGVCVADLDVAVAYYRALGFEAAEAFTLDQDVDWLATVTEVGGVKLRAQMMRDQEGATIELLKVLEPGASGSRERRALHQLGLTHIAFWDDDMEATIERLSALGGHFVEAAHVRTPTIELQHGADPDGVRIELMRLVTG
jgi:catechol 2,3-dioxygenase-like lactoylglutathione lyase family enzyme